MGGIFGIHADAVLLREQRAAVLTQNIANSSVPNYKARDIDFYEVLHNEDSALPRLTTTNSQHIAPSSQELSSEALQYRVPTRPTLDGNTVSVELEQAKFAENALRHSVSLSLLRGRIQSIRSAIQGGE